MQRSLNVALNLLKSVVSSEYGHVCVCVHTVLEQNVKAKPALAVSCGGDTDFNFRGSCLPPKCNFLSSAAPT